MQFYSYAKKSDIFWMVEPFELLFATKQLLFIINDLRFADLNFSRIFHDMNISLFILQICSKKTDPNSNQKDKTKIFEKFEKNN